MPILSSAPHLIKCHGRPLHAANAFGPQAKEFIMMSKERYSNGSLSPPLTQANVDTIYQLLLPLNHDLYPDKNGSAEDKMRALEWENTWNTLIAEYNQEGRTLSDEEIEKAQQDIFSAYRQKIIQLSTFNPKGLQTLEFDEIRAQEFLISISNCMSHFSAIEAFRHLYHQFMHEFENFLWLDIQILSRYLHMNQRFEYLKKFEEILSRKVIEFLGNEAIVRLFNAITKDLEFLKQLPLFIEESKVISDFFINYPDKRQRDEVLTTAMYEGLNQAQDLFLIKSMMQKTMMN